MQAAGIRRREKLDSTDVNSGEEPGKSHQTEVRPGERRGEPEANPSGQRHHDGQAGSLPAAAVPAIKHREIGDNQKEQHPEVERIEYTPLEPCESPEDSADEVGDGAERGAHEINQRDAQEQPDENEIRE